MARIASSTLLLPIQLIKEGNPDGVDDFIFSLGVPLGLFSVIFCSKLLQESVHSSIDYLRDCISITTRQNLKKKKARASIARKNCATVMMLQAFLPRKLPLRQAMPPPMALAIRWSFYFYMARLRISLATGEVLLLDLTTKHSSSFSV